MFKHGVVAIASLLLAAGTIQPAKAVVAAPTITPGIYRVSFWLNTTTGSSPTACAHVVNPNDPSTAYADAFGIAIPGPGQTGAVEYYSLAYPDNYTVKHVIDYPTTPTAGQVNWFGHLDGDPLEEGTKGGRFNIHIKSVTTYITMGTMTYNGTNADGSTCDVTANVAFEYRGTLP